jgi:5-deoxy-glucuronate isomerase
MAAPGYDLYYLNVMAGPGAREWLVRDDPAHGWVRKSWAGTPIDPRLPLTTSNERTRS